MDPSLIPIMIFIVTLVALIGGFVVFGPAFRNLLESWSGRVQDRPLSDGNAQLAELRDAVEVLTHEVSRLAERQDFTERLLEKPKAPPAS